MSRHRVGQSINLNLFNYEKNLRRMIIMPMVMAMAMSASLPVHIWKLCHELRGLATSRVVVTRMVS